MEVSYLQKKTYLCSKTPRFCTMIILLSLYVTETFRDIGSLGSDDPRFRAARFPV